MWTTYTWSQLNLPWCALCVWHCVTNCYVVCRVCFDERLKSSAAFVRFLSFRMFEECPCSLCRSDIFPSNRVPSVLESASGSWNCMGTVGNDPVPEKYLCLLLTILVFGEYIKHLNSVSFREAVWIYQSLASYQLICFSLAGQKWYTVWHPCC